VTVLDDEHEAVRRNTCRALGRLGAVLPVDSGSAGGAVAVDELPLAASESRIIPTQSPDSSRIKADTSGLDPEAVDQSRIH
jgi:hypothetical protein